MIVEISEFLSRMVYPLEITVIGLMAIFTIRKVIIDKHKTGNINWVRMIIFGVFLSFFIQSLLGFLNSFLNLSLPQFFSTMRDSYLTLGGIAIGSIVTLGIMLVTFSNRWESLYYAPAFLYAGLIIMVVSVTGFDFSWHVSYIEYGALIGLAFLYFTAFRLKDNAALGLAIFFTLAFSTIILELPLINSLLNIGYLIFGLLFVFGRFRVFKEEVA